MKSITICNAFSIQMISSSFPCKVDFEEISIMDIKMVIGDRETVVVSAIGHPDTAAVVSDLLGVEIPPNRANISLKKGDIIYVAQLMGGRLPEGSTTLPEGFKIKFIKVTVE